ncbi:TIM21-domain-containing protein [Pseudomassariella vexata]|uniref:Mitochondrial import inner membrane translocase subunit Tim21 n=1 Tax=Pseudomassariella vexata TaxID=1141098 RepID=A0A1Y2E1Z8_9PEZI|nr:TIM21-domain-containing protein [Pseudomassariella vexata]ORY65346.1 TIM21-domain-containing protein [Pseudomassariella vexata]
MKLVIRPSGFTTLAPHLHPLPTILQRRCYAAQHGLGTTTIPSSGPRRKTVTPFNDDGRVPWHELSAGEKTARATQQSFNFGLIIAGFALTGVVGYFLYSDVFSPDSKTAYFNRAVDRIRKDPDCLKLLGDAKKIEAHGEETRNKWRRARPIAATYKTDSQGNDHMMLHFYVHGPLNTGAANVHLVKRAGHSSYEYKYLYVDVPGQSRIYLENADTKTSSDSKKYKLFGVSWRK